MSLQAVPEKYDDVTPEWLGAALRSSGAITSQKVIEVTFEPLGAEYGRTSSLVIIHPSYDTPGDGPSALFAKFVSTIQSNREFVQQWDVFRYEIEVYRSLGGRLPVPMPRYYFGDYEDGSDVAVLMMEVVSGRRFTELPPDQRAAGLVAGTQRVALKPLAEMHAQWWNSKALDDLPWLREWTGSNATSLVQAADGSSFGDLREAVRPYLTAADLVLYDAAPHQLDRIEKSLTSMPLTLCHGDYHTQNMLWDSLPDANSVVVVDWQFLNRGPAVRDLSYFLGLSTGKDKGADVVADQVQFYCAELPDEIQAIYPVQEVMAGLAPAILDHIVRFQVLFTELDFAQPSAADFAGNLFARICNFGAAVDAGEWLTA